jgi:hypothetical protein
MVADKLNLRPEVMGWLEDVARRDNSKVLFMTGDPDAKCEYTTSEIIKEIRRGTEFGRRQYQVAVKLYGEMHALKSKP